MPVEKHREGVSVGLGIGAQTPRQHAGGNLRIGPELNSQHVARVMPGWRWVDGGLTPGGARHGVTLEHVELLARQSDFAIRDWCRRALMIRGAAGLRLGNKRSGFVEACGDEDQVIRSRPGRCRMPAPIHTQPKVQMISILVSAGIVGITVAVILGLRKLPQCARIPFDLVCLVAAGVVLHEHHITPFALPAIGPLDAPAMWLRAFDSRAGLAISAPGIMQLLHNKAGRAAS
jgi:hypothetical protein